MKLRTMVLCLLLQAAGGRAVAEEPAEQPAPVGLRALSGAVGKVARGELPLSRYLDRLEATLFLEQSHGTAGPYLVSVAVSLEALSEAERAGRGEHLLRRALVMLAAYRGPLAGRLASLYAIGYAQLVGARAEEATVSDALQHDLQRIGGYAADEAARRIAALPAGPEQAELRAQLALNLGRYGEALKAAQVWEQQQPADVTRSFRVGARYLQSGQGADELWRLEQRGGAAGVLAMGFSRRGAREGLLQRLAPVVLEKGRGKGRRAAPAPVQEQPILDACEKIVAEPQGGAKAATQIDCAQLLLESARSRWAERSYTTLEGGGARAVLLDVARALGRLVGLPGRAVEKDAAARGEALEEVSRLLPQAEVGAEEAGAAVLIAQVAAAPRPPGVVGIPAQLGPPIDKFLQGHPCSRAALPLLHGRHPDLEKRKAALLGLLQACKASGAPEAEDGQRQLALALLGMDGKQEGAYQTLKALAQGRRGYGEGRFALALADAEALRLGAAPSAEALERLTRLYEVAAAQLLPWDGAAERGRAAAQLTTLLLRRAQAQVMNPPRHQELLAEAQGQLRYALLLSPPEEQPRLQALEVALQRAQRNSERSPLLQMAAADVARLPPGVGRRLLACELAVSARLGKDVPRSAALAKLAVGEPLPEVVVVGQPRLSSSLGMDMRLRIGARGVGQVLLLPRCTI